MFHGSVVAADQYAGPMSHVMRLIPSPSERADNGKPNRDFLDREHAPYAIARYLQAMGFANWTHTMLLWLGNYDGFEAHIPQADDPLIGLRQLLAGYCVKKGRQTNIQLGQVAVDICKLPVVHWHASWFGRDGRELPPWDPINVAWLDFVTQGGEGDVLRVWKTPEPSINIDQLRHHLVASYVRQNGLR